MKQILTVKELAAHLRVHPTTIYNMLRAKQLPAFRVGTDWRFELSAIEEWQRKQAAQWMSGANETKRYGNGVVDAAPGARPQRRLPVQRPL